MKAVKCSVLAAVIIMVFAASGLCKDELKEAEFYKRLDNNAVQCLLCPRFCTIGEGQKGYCTTRKNIGGTLYSIVYAKPCAVHVDPIEKKPLFHFLPGSKSYSIATAGCNLRCIFCQNWEISQAQPELVESQYIPPEEIVQLAIKENCKSIAYTYTEPTIFYEYMLDVARNAYYHGVYNVMHTCGYINPEPLRKLCPFLKAANVDLKGFSDEFYEKIGNGKLAPVLETLKILKEEGVWLEITNLVIPTLNDDPKMIERMCVWIKDNLGPETPVHFSRFFPQHKLSNLPPTPIETLTKAKAIADKVGLKYVYIGNVAGIPAENTYCPKCGRLLIRRVGYFVLENNIENGKCKFCGEEIKGVWE